MKNIYFIIGSIGSAIICAAIVHGQAASGHSCDEKGDAPTATIDKPPQVIEVDGKYVVGVGISVTLKATITDKDKHKDSATDSGTDKSDTFDAQGAIQWKEKNNKGDILGGATTQATFTSLEPGDYEIVLKVKDDGAHYKDFTTLTEVKTFSISVVNPDGVKVKENGIALVQSSVLGGAEAKGPVTWQVTYQDQDLKWKGKLAEKFKKSSTLESFQSLPYAFNSSGAEQWPDWQIFAVPVTDGTLQDDQGTGSGNPFPDNSYWDAAGLQEIGYVDKSGNKVPLGKFKNQQYIKRVGGEFTSVAEIVPE